MTPHGMEVTLCLFMIGIKHVSSVLIIGSSWQVLSNSHCSSLKIILINRRQFVLCHGCSIQIVSTILFSSTWLLFSSFWLILTCFCSLCWWEYLLGHSPKPVESYIWCCCYSYLHPGNNRNARTNIFYNSSSSLIYFVVRSRCSVTLIRILLQTRKLHECSAKANVSTTEESARLWNKAGLLTSYIVFVVERLSSSTLNLIPLSCFTPPTLLSLSLFSFFLNEC